MRDLSGIIAAKAAPSASIKRYALKLVLLSLLLLWPAFLNGRPLYFSDTVSYLKGGEYAVQYAGKMLTQWERAPAERAGNAVDADNSKAPPAISVEKKISGMRSVTYSVAAYLTRAPGDSMFMTAAAQSIAIAFLMLVLFQKFGVGEDLRSFMILSGFMAFATTAPWYVSFVMPDIWAGAAILGIALLVAFSRSLPAIVLFSIVGIVAFAVSAHASHILLAAAITAVGVVITYLQRRKSGTSAFAGALLISAPLLLGIGGTVAINFFGIGEASVAAKRYPITLARSVADGPARWHLEKKCSVYQYVVCDVFDEIPHTLQDFLWQPGGLRYKATPEQMEQIRAEEVVILRRAAAEYPLAMIGVSLRNALHQSVLIGVSNLSFNENVVKDSEAEYALADSGVNRRPPLWPFEVLQYGTAVAALLVLAWLYRSRRSLLSRSDFTFLTTIIIGFAANAAVCGVLSGVTDRYQGRVIWVLPMTACAIVLRESRRIKMGGSTDLPASSSGIGAP